jgi:hypothetical protein
MSLTLTLNVRSPGLLSFTPGISILRMPKIKDSLGFDHWGEVSWLSSTIIIDTQLLLEPFESPCLSSSSGSSSSDININSRTPDSSLPLSTSAPHLAAAPLTASFIRLTADSLTLNYIDVDIYTLRDSTLHTQQQFSLPTYRSTHPTTQRTHAIHSQSIQGQGRLCPS